MARIPEGVREVIGRRLDNLSDRCNELLTKAAVIGRDFDVRVLGALIPEVGEDIIIDLLEEAQVASVLEEIPKAFGRYRFNHALTRETLVEEITGIKRTRLHAKIVEVVEEIYGENADKHAIELAGHCAVAEPIVGQEKVQHYLIESGEQSLVVHAFESALEYFDRALEIKMAETCDKEFAAICYGRARAQAALFNPGAEESFHNAFECFEHLDNADGVVAVATWPNLLFTNWLHSDKKWFEDACRRALELVESDSVEGGYVRASLARLVFWRTGDFRAAKASLNAVLDLAKERANFNLQMRAYATLASVASISHRFNETIEYAKCSLDLAQQCDDPRAEADACSAIGQAYRRRWDTREIEFTARYLKTAEGLGSKQYLAAAYRDSWYGAFPRANLEKSLGYLKKLSPDFSDIAGYWLRLARNELELGNMNEFRTSVDRAIELLNAFEKRQITIVSYLSQFSYVTGERSYLAVAERFACKVWNATGETPEMMLHVSNDEKWLTIARRDKTRAEQICDDMKNNLDKDWGFFGLVARTADRIDEALSYFEQAVERTQRVGYRLQEYWVTFWLAETLVMRDTPGDVERALTLADETIANADAVGMIFLRDKAAAFVEQIRKMPINEAVAVALPDGLTEREVEVLRLVAAGKTNKDVGEDLFISAKTVNAHLAYVYAKIGASNRTEAATYAIKHGLWGQ